LGRGIAPFVTPFFTSRQPLIYYSQLVHGGKMCVVGPLPRVWLRNEFGVLIQDTGKFAGRPRRFSCLIGRTLQSLFLAH
jgi:hypothetical protein